MGEPSSPFDRISRDPAILGGKPCIKGTRIIVELVLELFASGGTRDEILRKYPHLKNEDLEQALRFAAESLRGDIVVTARLAG